MKRLALFILAVSLCASAQYLPMGSVSPVSGVTPTAATPTFDPVAGTYSGTQSVTISSSTAGSTLCYTTDGSDPAASTPGTCSAGSTYATPVSVASSLTLKALATKAAYLNSAVGSAAYTINAPAGYSDAFTGADGTALATHDSNWVSMDGTYVVGNFTLNTNAVRGAAWLQAGALHNASTSDTAQIVFKAQPSGSNNYTKYICVRATASTTKGYCANMSGVSGSNWTTVAAWKNGISVGTAATGLSLAINADHTVKIVVSGTSSVTITVFVDSTQVLSVTDSTSTITSGHPAFYVAGNGQVADNAFDAWQDN